MIQFPSRYLQALYDPEMGLCITSFPDGTEVRSRIFDEQAAFDYGYGREGANRFSAEHDLMHNFVAERLGRFYSNNHWLIAHGCLETDHHAERDLEEALIAGFAFIMHRDRLPVHGHESWTRTPEVYMTYSESIFDAAGIDIRESTKEFRQIIRTIERVYYGKQVSD